MLSRFLLFALPVLTFGGTGSYNYDRCNTTNGPSAWTGQCNPNQQAGTPINLCAAVAFTNSSQPTLSVSGYSTSRKIKFHNPGNTLQITIIDNYPQLQAGSLAYTVGRSTNSSTQSWILLQMHMHWGRNANEGSEHYLQGQQYPLEAHFVHYNARYPNISAAVGSGNSDALLVVGVFFEISTSDVDTMSVIANAVSGETQTPTELSSSVTLSDMFDGTGNFYSYPGSLTTPGCLEVVTWIVMSATKPIKQSTLTKIWKASTNPPVTAGQKFAVQASTEVISKYGNFRPLQARAGRTVYYTGGATAACTNVTEPTFTCSNSASSSASNFGRTVGLFPIISVIAFIWTTVI